MSCPVAPAAGRRDRDAPVVDGDDRMHDRPAGGGHEHHRLQVVTTTARAHQQVTQSLDHALVPVLTTKVRRTTGSLKITLTVRRRSTDRSTMPVSAARRLPVRDGSASAARGA